MMIIVTWPFGKLISIGNCTHRERDRQTDGVLLYFVFQFIIKKYNILKPKCT